MTQRTDRRQWLIGATALAVGAPAAAGRASRPSEHPLEEPVVTDPAFRYCLNTSTLRGQKLPLAEEVRIAAEAGYTGIEPWIREIQAHRDGGGSLADLKKQIADSGLTVESAIGFSNWIVDDDNKRSDALEQAKREMDLVRQIGGTRIAAPPAGATNQENLDLNAAARRYRALLELGQEMGVTPQLELWGFSKTLSRLGELAHVAVESGHPDACVMPDVYHIYKGGSDFNGLKLFNGQQIHVFHMNDYPAQPPRDQINDAARVYPGDGVAPLSEIFQTLRSIGFNGVLSLELFNPNYWKQDPREVARTGLQKMKQVASL
ncbi:MAG: sugar phosphate isomerase/epimerase [Mariniblastus sp.]|nr:sugar phosphate isomerase/epimerase [Mariniblastus sp.]